MTEKQKALNSLTSRAARREGLKKQVSIGNIRECARVFDELLGGDFYKLVIRSHSKNK